MSTIVAPSSFTFDSFAETPLLSLVQGEGQVSPDYTPDGRLRLVPAQARLAAAAWFKKRVRLSMGFSTDFRFLLSNTGGEPDEKGVTGADGFAFVVQGAGSDVCGTSGCGLGYHGIANSLAVEFDTFLNGTSGKYDQTDVNEGGNNPHSHHVSINTRGDEANSAWHKDASLACTAGELILGTPEGVEHLARISYEPGQPRGESPSIRVFLDDLTIPILQVTLSSRLEALLGLTDRRTAWVGFTAATGAGWQNHDILSWTFTAPLPIGG